MPFWLAMVEAVYENFLRDRSSNILHYMFGTELNNHQSLQLPPWRMELERNYMELLKMQNLLCTGVYDYSHIKRILLLADLDPDGNEYSQNPYRVSVDLAERIAKRNPSVHVIKSDMELASQKVWTNLDYLMMDNSKTFPLDDVNVDMIVMRRGLCECTKENRLRREADEFTIQTLLDTPIATCGGIPTNITSMTAFLLEVARVLNKNNAQSVAYLDGGESIPSSSTRLWHAAALDTMAAFPSVLIEPVFLDNGTELKGLKISVAD